MDRVESIIRNCEMPAMPLVAMKIVSLADSPDSSVADLQDAILADQSLSARVLRIANGAYYGGFHNVETISDAIMVMGFEAIKNLALAISTRSIYKKFGLLEQKLWEHSIGTSVAAGIITRELKFPNSEEAIVAGLLHDIGKAVMNNSEPEKFLLLMEMVYNERVHFSERETEVFGFGHEEVGGLFAERWKFSGQLCYIIRKHHSCNPDDGTFEGDDVQKPLLYITALADSLCARLGVGYNGPMTDLVLMDGAWKNILGITEERYSRIIEKFKLAYVQEKMLYQL